MEVRYETPQLFCNEDIPLEQMIWRCESCGEEKWITADMSEVLPCAVVEECEDCYQPPQWGFNED